MFVRHDVVNRDQVVPVSGGLLADIHDHSRAHQPLERNLIRGVLAFAEMDRRVQMGAPMLGGGYCVGCVPESGRVMPSKSVFLSKPGAVGQYTVSSL